VRSDLTDEDVATIRRAVEGGFFDDKEIVLVGPRGLRGWAPGAHEIVQSACSELLGRDVVLSDISPIWGSLVFRLMDDLRPWSSK